MDRLTKEIDWRGRKVTVSELLLGDIEFLSRNESDQLAQLVALVRLTTGLEQKDINQASPSALKPLVAAVLEVNADFFDQARALGMEESASALEKLIKSIFIVGLLPSPEQGLEMQSGDTPGADS